MTDQPKLYRHYFNAPLTGSFVAPHENFDDALTHLFKHNSSPRTQLNTLCTVTCEPKYTIDNIEPVDMPNNPLYLSPDLNQS
jgi:hypothetical protein